MLGYHSLNLPFLESINERTYSRRRVGSTGVMTGGAEPWPYQQMQRYSGFYDCGSMFAGPESVGITFDDTGTLNTNAKRGSAMKVNDGKHLHCSTW